MSSKVSVICISYNHAPFVKQALESVFAQTYESIEIIVLDDGSNDHSVEEIKNAIGERNVQTVFHSQNEGYTRTFNEGFAMSSGDFVVDFALDDVMKPDFIQRSIDKFESSPKQTGVVFSNADYINEQGEVIGNHNETLFRKGMLSSIPSGDVFEMMLRRYFICTPTMVIRREVLERLGGYDETLAYEDFDFWIRSGRYWEYAYLDEVLMQKRKLAQSMSNQRHRFQFNEQMNSVFKVCEKAFHLTKTKSEKKALLERLNYEYRQCLRVNNHILIKRYRQLIHEAGGHINPFSFLANLINREKINSLP